MIIHKTSDDDIDKFIFDKITLYYTKLDGWKDNIKLNGKNIERATIEQASWVAYYDELRVEVKSILDYYIIKIKQVRGKVYQDILKHSKLSHTEKSMERILNSSNIVMQYDKIYIELKELYNLCDCITESFRSRGYTLNNIVKIRIAELENINLYD